MSVQDSYLGRLSPWTRSPVVQPSQGKDGEPEPLPKQQQQQGQDHTVMNRHRLSLRKYPRDCPPLRPQWFHAIDVPLRRPNPAGPKEEKPLPAPKKYSAFSVRDSKAIEAAYLKLAQGQETAGVEQHLGDISLQAPYGEQRSDSMPNLSLKDNQNPGGVKVPVNEDYLFDVDVAKRELGPAYWLGPVYAVRRGTWFYQDGGVQRPCDENLAAQLEDGYLKVNAWKLKSQSAEKARSSSQPRARPSSWTPGHATLPVSTPISPKGSDPELRKRALEDDTKAQDRSRALETGQFEPPENTYRLFGDANRNSVVTYQDATTAWLLTDDFMSRMNYSMYQRFAGGGHFGGVKLVRGHVPVKKDDSPDVRNGAGKQAMGEGGDTDTEDAEKPEASAEGLPERPSNSEIRREKLARHMSSLLEDPSNEDRGKQEEEMRKRDEREMEEDYLDLEGDEQNREIEHLILVTHGIGQRLGLRIESVNFVHDVNTLRKTMKAVYAESPDLRALNAELEAGSVNSRVQVLPICWRHLLDFPKQSLKHNRKEQDLADTEHDDEEYPSLEDISVEGVPAVRNLITDLALDILLYQSPAYKGHISRIVLEECNRIYHLFMQRNPDFKGKVSFIGHSLGSAVMFDILCRQGQQSQSTKRHSKDPHHQKLDFEVEDFYALGSPIGLFQMLKGRTVQARKAPNNRTRTSSTSMDDPMLDVAAPPGKNKFGSNDTSNSDIAVSSPKCAQLFNIFHPTDPISYRLEPLISQAMSALKPQPLPYTKRGIFGAPMGQGLTGIGARVSQSVSSMWSNMASSLLTRGLGYNGSEAAQLPNAQNPGKSSAPLSVGAGSNATASVVPTVPALPAKGTEIAKVNADPNGVATDALSAGESGQHPPTLIDAELETLYGGYQKRRKSVSNDATHRDLGAGAVGHPEWYDSEERAKRLKREEEKVRRLNSNGRVDYAIQEGAFDINLIAAIASHLSYWSDEDVSHFVVSQLLSRHRVVRPRATSGTRPR